MTYTPKVKPWAHQVEALDRMKGKEAFALLAAMRTGKSKMTLDDYGRLEAEGEVKNLLLIAPGGVYKTWEKAIIEHLSDDLLSRVRTYTWVSGKNSKNEQTARARFMSHDNDVPRILLMNVESLSSVAGAREMALKFLDQGPAMLVVDESTIIKNHRAKRTKFINTKLSPLADYRRILSGLPTPQSPLDLYSQFEFLDWRIIGQKSYYSFRNRYALMERKIFGGRRVDVVVGYRDVEDLNRRIMPHSYRVRLEDCYDVPKKMYAFRDVQMTPEQKRLYAEMRDFATAELEAESHVTATIVISQILRLHQILCGHVPDELGNLHEVPENRTSELLALLSEFDGKAIIWCSYDQDVRKVMLALEKEYGTFSAAAFWGGNRATRENEEARFLNDPNCRFMVSTAAAGGKGRTWTVASLVVYYSNTPNLEHRIQSEDRPQGIGKDDKVLYVDLRVPDTVEEKIIDNLRAKIDISSAIMGDGYKEWLI